MPGDQAGELRHAGASKSADEEPPQHENHARYGTQMLEDRERLVVHRVGHVPGRRAPVVVGRRGRVMVDRDGGVVPQFPGGAPQREAKRHVLTDELVEAR
jgi:hypothetical protein